MLEKKKTPSSSFFIFLFLFEAKKTMTQACRCLFFLVIFVANKAMTTSLLPSQNFPLLPTYLISFCVHSIVKVQKNLKWEGKRGNAKLRTKSKKADYEPEAVAQKW
jgi:hypothetical protein